MPFTDTPLTLIHRPSGDSKVFYDAHAVSLFLLTQGICAYKISDRWYNPTSDALLVGPWVLLNAYGERLAQTALVSFRRSRSSWGHPHVYRHDPVPNTAYHRSRYRRRPHTTTAIREALCVEAQEGEPSVRCARSRRHLPTVRDDIWRWPQRSWKSQRKHQWKS